MVNNANYGGFVVSRNVLSGTPIRYSYREKSSLKELNGWNLLSEKDDDEYLSDTNNFVIVNADTIYKLAPVMMEIFEAPYGTDLFWLYEAGVQVGFYDLIEEKEVTIEQILN